MSRNNSYQQIEELISSIPSLHNQEKDIICNDCGGISASKIQQLLSKIEDTTQSFNKILLEKKKIKSAKNNNQKSSLQRKKNKRIHRRKLNRKKKQSPFRNNNRHIMKKKNK